MTARREALIATTRCGIILPNKQSMPGAAQFMYEVSDPWALNLHIRSIDNMHEATWVFGLELLYRAIEQDNVKFGEGDVWFRRVGITMTLTLVGPAGDMVVAFPTNFAIAFRGEINAIRGDTSSFLDGLDDEWAALNGETVHGEELEGGEEDA